jgi:hypothetical protein
MATVATTRPLLATSVVTWALRLLVLAALVVDAIVHLRLAADYQLAAPAGIGQGNLFRIEAVVALAAALYVGIRGTRPAFLVALSVLGGGLAAVLLYRYVQVPAFGPIPSMYEPLWFYSKTLSAVAEAAGAVVALAALGWSFRGTSNGTSPTRPVSD